MLKVIKFYNYSGVFGGQERFLQILIKSLSVANQVDVCGGPEKILKQVKPKPKQDTDCESNIEIFNGNRALYKQALKFKQGARIYVQHSHINDGQEPAYKRLIRKVLIWLLTWRVDGVIRVCKDAFPARYGHGRVYTVYNGVPIPPVQASLKLVNDDFRLVMVGAINANKNQKQAIELLAQLPGTRLTLVGSGPYQTELERYASVLGVSDRVQWVGFVDDPQPYILRSHVLLMLSQFEAFPFSVIEAMALGVPVVAFPVGGVPEAIEHGVNGLLVEERTTKSLEEAIQPLISDHIRLTRMGQAARESAINRFSEECMTNEFMAVVSEVCKQVSH